MISLMEVILVIHGGKELRRHIRTFLTDLFRR